MEISKKMIFRIKTWWAMTINSFHYLKFKSPLVLNAWVNIKHGEIIHRNWGDDVNLYLIEELSGKKVIFRNMSIIHRLFPFTNYICIGSILGWYENKCSTIWGAGFIDQHNLLRCKPRKILSVRGKLSRDIVLSQGIECPESYGDPVLLISQFYKPCIECKNKMGIIVHFAEADNSIIKDFMDFHPNCIIIDLVNYTTWTDVIDKILSCNKIISSSLHGLIVSDSYGIPNKWVSFSDKVVGDGFKFKDYFSSINRIDNTPIPINSTAQLMELYNVEFTKNIIKINFKDILNKCPFITSK